MIMTGENRNTRRKACRSEALSTTHPALTGLGSNLDLHGESSTPYSLNHGMARLSVFPYFKCENIKLSLSSV
jgi:hypothetical protein